MEWCCGYGEHGEGVVIVNGVFYLQILFLLVRGTSLPCVEQVEITSLTQSQYRESTPPTLPHKKADFLMIPPSEETHNLLSLILTHKF